MSPAMMTTASSPLRESTRNIGGVITPSESWSSIMTTSSTSTASTSPLRISRRDSPLTSDTVPNHHYHRLPTQLARRQSSSYNHVRNNHLVSKSPFKVQAAARPSRIPTPSRIPSAKDDENDPKFAVKRRQSRGFQGLLKEQAVTKSPFKGDRRSVVADKTPLSPSQPPASPRLPTPETPPPETVQPRPLTPPMTTPPRNPRVAEFPSISPSPSPKSSLVSSKRLYGPRSLSTSPSGDSAKRQRRKTVTFDERCDVLEFDQDEVSEDALDTDDADFYGLPDPASPAVSTSTDGSFLSDAGEELSPEAPYMTPKMVTQTRHTEQSGRSPRISREEIRRRLLEQRGEEFDEHRDLLSPPVTPEGSFDVSLQTSDIEPTSDRQENSSQNSLPEEENSFLGKAMGASFDFNDPNIDLGEMQSALDRLMLGVKSGFGLGLTDGESMSNDTAAEEDISANANSTAVLSNISSDEGDGGLQPNHNNSHEVAETSEGLSADEDSDIPVTPPITDGIGHKPPGSTKESNFLHGASPLEDSLPGTPSPIQGDESLLTNNDPSNLSLAEVSVNDISTANIAEEDVPDVRTSGSARGKDQESSGPNLPDPSGSLSLPPLVFDIPPPAPFVPTTHLARLPETMKRGGNSVARSFSASSNDSIPPPVPPKDRGVTQGQDDYAQARKREMRGNDERDRPATYDEGRPSRRRSLSTGDAEDLASSKPAAQRRADRLRDERDVNLLNIPLERVDENDALADAIDRELKIRRKPTVKEKIRKYQLREQDMIYASADDKVSHMSRAGDVDTGKAWRTVRRPSDMNEYSRQIKEFKSQQKPGKAHGKVFVRVLGIKGLNVPLPPEPTAFTCTLNNGIHFVTTPECRLGKDSRIEQEFELIEHSKLEFTLTLKVRRDPHINAQARSNTTPNLPITTAPPSQSSSRGGIRSFLGVGGSPKKAAHKVTVSPAARGTPEPVVDNLARYLKSDGTLARAFISFKEIAKRCDTRLLETSFPLIGQRMDGSSTSTVANPRTMGEIVLQIFRLPPLAGIPPDQLPQSLEECQRGLRHNNWHKVTYHEGVLTQCGGDCRTWRRRLLRITGSNVVAFNDVTKKATVTIDLKKAISVEDDDPSPDPITSPASAMTSRSRNESDGVYRVERSFRLIFPNDEEISFFADNDEAKARWLQVLRALVGHIPPNPLWAELVWQRQEELAKSTASSIPVSAQPVTHHTAASPR